MNGESVKSHVDRVCRMVEEAATGPRARKALAAAVVAAAASLGAGCAYAAPHTEHGASPGEPQEAVDCSLPENQGHELCGGDGEPAPTP